ncbi:MAG: hypothetical protein GY749_38310 [Desulfobacteraceae bacterium]|nr:hypothetical protein [Desulfobacteraceae bacterium]
MKKTHLGKYFKQYLDKGFYLSYVVIKVGSLHYRISAQVDVVFVIRYLRKVPYTHPTSRRVLCIIGYLHRVTLCLSLITVGRDVYSP